MMMAEALFEKLRTLDVLKERSPYAINLGCGDGLQYEDPVFPLYRSGFKGVAIDAWNHEALADNLGAFDVVLKPATMLSTDNVVAILRDAGCPANPAFLKIDIDGFDADILKAVLAGGIRPLVIQAEVNTEVPPPYAFSVCWSDKFRPGGEYGFYGFSLTYGVDLLARYGYRFYQLDFETGWTHDGLWVHESILSRAGLPHANPVEEFMRRGPHIDVIKTASRETLESWRTRTDFDVVRNEIWHTMIEASRMKHGHVEVPFELYVSR